MKYFIDTEFIEGFKKHFLRKPVWTIDLISIGVVCEDGREYYALNKEVDLKRVWKDKWLRENVLAGIYQEYVHGDMRNVSHFCYSTMKWLFNTKGKNKDEIGVDLRFFMFPSKEECKMIGFGEYKEKYGADILQIWGYYSDYDWVVICSNLYGKMLNLPKGFPMYCLDLKQLMNASGLGTEWKRSHCPDPKGEHNALVDARWNYKLYKEIMFEQKIHKESLKEKLSDYAKIMMNEKKVIRDVIEDIEFIRDRFTGDVITKH